VALRVVHGLNDQSFDCLFGRTVGQVRKALREVFNIPSDASAFLGGVEVGDDHVLGETGTLEFVKVAGVKGLGALLTPEELCQQWNVTPDEYLKLVSMGLPSIRFGNGGVRHPECGVDEFFRHLGNPDRSTPPDLVGSPYVADRLGCTTVWVTQMVRQGEIPQSCVATGTGNGRPWKFHRARIDEWLRQR